MLGRAFSGADAFVIIGLCRSKQSELRKTGDAFELRARESVALPKALRNAHAFFKNTRQTLGSWVVTKPWLNKTELEDLEKEVKASDPKRLTD